MPRSVMLSELGDSIYLNPRDPVDSRNDADQDGLLDGYERILAGFYRPYLRFDAREPRVSKSVSEPFTLYQVRPNGCVGLGCGGDTYIWVRYVFLYRNDHGYVAGGLCHGAGGHSGDNDAATFKLASRDQGRTWRLYEIEVGGPSDGMVVRHPDLLPPDYPKWNQIEWYEEGQGPAGSQGFFTGSGRYHASIYVGAGTHHLYLDQSNNGEDSGYSQSWFWDCDEAVKGDSAENRLVELNTHTRNNNNGVGPDWFIERVILRDEATGARYTGTANRWLRSAGDQVIIDLVPANRMVVGP